MGIVFIAFIIIMNIIRIFTPNKSFSDLENRPLEQKPNLSVEDVTSKKYSQDYGNYLSDQFPFRNSFINLKSKFEQKLGIKDISDVYLGKNGYLLQRFKKPADVTGLSESINAFSKKNPKVNTYVMLVPNACEILKDYLPQNAPNESEAKYVNMLKSQLNNNVKFVDVSSALESKKNEYLFYKTDHHWTTDGAYYGYRKFISELGLKYNNKNYYNINTVTNDFYGTLYSKVAFDYSGPDKIKTYTPKTETKYTIQFNDGAGYTPKSNSLYQPQNLKVKDKYTVFLGGNHSLVKISTNAKTNKRILIVRDSYANCFVPFLLPYFKDIYMVDLRYYSDDINKFIKKNDIDTTLILYNVITFFEDQSIKGLEPSY